MITTKEAETMQLRASTRRDGVYSYNGYYYAVKNNNFVGWVTRYGECYQRFTSFNIKLGDVEPSTRKKELEKLLPQL